MVILALTLVTYAKEVDALTDTRVNGHGSPILKAMAGRKNFR